MKNYIKTITLLLLSSIFISSSCKKNTPTNTEEQLPPETQTGAFTIGFKVDGIVFTAKGKGGLLGDQHVNYAYYSDTTFYIDASKTIDKKFSFYLTFKCSSLNTACLLNTYPFEANFQDNSNGTIVGSSNSYSTNNTNGGKVIVKYFNGTFNPLTTGNIVSGIFDFNAVNSNGKIIHITEGRFDIGR